MKKLAQYNEEKLRDKGAAFGWWLKAHAEDHECEEHPRSRSSGSPPRRRAGTQLVDAYAASLPKFGHAKMRCRSCSSWRASSRRSRATSIARST